MAAALAAMVAVSSTAASCSTLDERAARDPLEPLHRPVGTDVLDRPALVAAPAPEPAAPTDPWRVSNVLDGRTIEIYRGLERVTATIGGIVVPTEDECLADVAADSLTFITGGGRPVEVVPSVPRQNRILDATVVTADGQDVGEAMLSLGLARIDPDAPTRRDYDEAQEAARRAGEGVWSDDCDDERNDDQDE